MIEQHYYADVNLPLHVWVRERAGARGYRWVLRKASEMQDPNGPQERAPGEGPAPGTPLN